MPVLSGNNILKQVIYFEPPEEDLNDVEYTVASWLSNAKWKEAHNESVVL